MSREAEAVYAVSDEATCNNVSHSDDNDSEREKESESLEQEESAVSENLSTSQSAYVNEKIQSVFNDEGAASTSYLCKEMKYRCCGAASLHVKGQMIMKLMKVNKKYC